MERALCGNRGSPRYWKDAVAEAAEDLGLKPSKTLVPARSFVYKTVAPTASCSTQLGHVLLAVGVDGVQGLCPQLASRFRCWLGAGSPCVSLWTLTSPLSRCPHCGSPSCSWFGYSLRAGSAVGFELPPVIDAAQSSSHVPQTGLTATCGPMLDLGVQWYGPEGGKSVVRLLTTNSGCGGTMRENAFAVHSGADCSLVARLIVTLPNASPSRVHVLVDSIPEVDSRPCECRG